MALFLTLGESSRDIIGVPLRTPTPTPTKYATVSFSSTYFSYIQYFTVFSLCFPAFSLFSYNFYIVIVISKGDNSSVFRFTVIRNRQINQYSTLL